MKKRVAEILIIMILTLNMTMIPTTVNAVELPLRVVIDNVELAFPDAQPFIDQNNRTQTPARFIGEALGATVTWDKAIKTVYVASGKNEFITGSDEVTYYDGVAYNPYKDATIYGYLTREKLIDFYIEAADNFAFIKENGVLYVSGEYPELPSDFILNVNFRIHYKEGLPQSYVSLSRGNEEFIFPTEGSFKKKVLKQTTDDITGMELFFVIRNKLDGHNDFTFLIEYDKEWEDYDKQASLIEAGGDYRLDYTDKIDFDAIFMWY